MCRRLYEEVCVWLKECRYADFGGVWTCERVAQEICKEFAVSYCLAHVSRMVRTSGLSSQKPQRRVNQQDKQASSAGKKKRWLELKKGL